MAGTNVETVCAGRNFGIMKIKRPIFSRLRGGLWLATLALTLPACQPGQARLAQLEATQQQQAREIATLKQQLADKEQDSLFLPQMFNSSYSAKNRKCFIAGAKK